MKASVAPATFAAVIDLWPKAVDFADDVGVTAGQARLWRHRNSIPGDFWSAVAKAAKKRGHATVTLDLLAGLAAARRAA